MFRLASRAIATPARVALRQQQQPVAVWKAAYSASALNADSIKARITDVLQSFEKVDPSKVTPTASFVSDLGLDSLDAVEVVMAIEEEFSIEIPDEEADKITTVAQAIEYISKSPEAH
ncbi:acyl carrier protein [Meredithblackwellia eburnea MCA 4105]